MSHCEGCAAPVEWRKHVTTGKAAPVDTTPTPDGNVLLEGPGEYRVLTKREIKALDNPGLFDDDPPDRYTLHFATCPRAAHYRRCGRCRHTPCRCGRVG